MEGKIPTRSSPKRSFVEEFVEGESTKPQTEKRVRFPDRRIKVKTGDDEELPIVEEDDDHDVDAEEARLAAHERAKRRCSLLSEEEINDASDAEVSYEENENFVEDGIQIEPFNFDKEREQGYFDAHGNFVEYVRENQIKDACLDGIELDPRYAGLNSVVSVEDNENDTIELTNEDIGMIKKRIASVLEPGETVLQALRRLKGGSNKRKEKMSTETQLLFEKLTENANKLLLEHGEYNVYHDKKEVFEWEAEGLSLSRGEEDSDYSIEDLSSNDTEIIVSSSVVLSNSVAEVSNTNAHAAETSKNDANTVAKQDDYVYDEISGYYYSSSSGYYYDAYTGLYCYAVSGQWYSYNEETGRYDDILQAASNVDGNYM